MLLRQRDDRVAHCLVIGIELENIGDHLSQTNDDVFRYFAEIRFKLVVKIVAAMFQLDLIMKKIVAAFGT